MKVFKGGGTGRVIKLSLQRGDKLLESIKEALINTDVKDAVVVSGIGTLEQLVFHRVLSFDHIPKEEFITINRPIELSSIQGIIANREPHLHLVCSDDEGKVYTGHLEPNCIVLYLAEIVIVETTGKRLRRERDENNLNRLNEINE